MPPKTAQVKLHSSAHYDVKQSQYDNVPRLPCQNIVLAPTFSGKSVLLVSLMLDVYRDCFARIIVFSNSMFLDTQWEPLMKYCEETHNIRREECFFDHFDEQALLKIIDRQYKIAQMCKKAKPKMRHCPQIAIIADDVIDDPKFTRSKAMETLFVRGRHLFCSTWASSQKQRGVISPVIRAQAMALYVFALRNSNEVKAFVEEFGAIFGEQATKEIYQKAVYDQPHSFLLVNLREKDPNKMFQLRFEAYLTPA